MASARQIIEVPKLLSFWELNFIDFRKLLVKSFIRRIILEVWEAFPAFGTVSNGSESSNNGGLVRRELLACLRCRNPAILVISGS